MPSQVLDPKGSISALPPARVPDRPAVAPERRRGLGLHHVAFYRGHLQGLDLRALADRYLEPGCDLRLARRRLTWIRDELRAALRRDGRPGARWFLTIKAVVPGVAEAPKPATPPMTLEQFRQEHDPQGVYTERELIEIYQAEVARPLLAGAATTEDRRLAQRARFHERQMALLDELERAAARPPALTDPMDLWLDPVLVKRLKAAKIPGFPALLQRVNALGHDHWHEGIDSIGPEKAARVVAWLAAHAREMGVSLETWALKSSALLPAEHRRDAGSYGFDVVPLERILLPAEVDGRHGVNRSPHPSPLFNVPDDLAAILRWLEVKARNPNTRDAYRKEAERILLWATLKRGKPLSSLNHHDCLDYETFLGRVPPDWVSERPQQRWSRGWRPFCGELIPPTKDGEEPYYALSKSSRRTAISIVRALFEFLVRRRHISENPWDEVTRQASSRGINARGRSFTPRQWAHLIAFAEDLPEGPRRDRLRFILGFGRASALRLAELIDARLADLYTEHFDRKGEDRWFLRVPHGKGSGEVWSDDVVSVPSSAIALVRDYFEARGLPFNPAAFEPKTRLTSPPLISHTWSGDRGKDRTRPISRSALYKDLKAFLREAACAADDEADAAALRRASTHWLRHTYGRQMAAQGVHIDVIRANMRHADISTTGIYVEPDLERQSDAVEQAFGK